MIRISVIPMMLISLLSAMNLAVAGAAQKGWNEAGIRTGFQEGTRYEYFRQYDVFAVYGLPWDWRTSSGWGLDTNLEMSAGALQGGTKSAFIGSVGPGLSINKSGKGLALDLVTNSGILGRRRFIKQDFGSVFMFGAYMGVSYLFESGIKVGYRVLHLSNGHILYSNCTPNPGLESHLMGVSWNF